MKREQIKIRWNSYAFCEIVLPNGIVIVTDPYQFGANPEVVAEPDYAKHIDKTAAEIVERCDYILVSHTHFDHVDDLKYLMEKFPDARLIVPDMSCLSLVIHNNFNPLRMNIILVGDNDRLEFDDFTLDCYRGKHTVFASTDPFYQTISKGERPYREDPRYQNPDGGFNAPEAEFFADGGLDFRNYLITTGEGMKIFLWAGQIKEDFRRRRYYGMKPDVMFVQVAGTNIGGDRKNPSGATISEFTMDVEPRLVLPIHQEKFTYACLDQIKEQCERSYAENGRTTRFFSPKAYVWNTITREADGSIQAEPTA